MSCRPPSEGDASRKLAVSLLAAMHQTRCAHNTACRISAASSPDTAHDPRGQPFEEVKTHCELPSLHQLTALIDALIDACAATHPDPSRVPSLVNAATSLLSRALRGSTVVLCGSNWRLLLLSAIGLASKYMDDEHLCFVQLLRLHSACSAAEAPAGAPSVLQPLQPQKTMFISYFLSTW